jgi:hypothetical protein
MLELGGQELLADDVPARPRSGEAARYPLGLSSTEHGVVAAQGFFAAQRFAVAAGVSLGAAKAASPGTKARPRLAPTLAPVYFGNRRRSIALGPVLL